MQITTPNAIGGGAILTTTGLIVLQVLIAAYIPRTSAIEITAILALVLEGIIVIALAAICISGASNGVTSPKTRRLGTVVGTGAALSTAAGIISAVTIVLLNEASDDIAAEIMGIPRPSILIAYAVLLGLSYGFQVVFLVAHFLSKRKSLLNKARSILRPNESFHNKSTLKSVPYDQTQVDIERGPDASSIDSRSISASTGGKSGLESSVGSVSSRTRLLSRKEKRRPASIESAANRSSTEDNFESWDTSAVDANHRQTVLDLSSSPPPKGRFLETIPASPTGSRSPSPGSSFELPLPPPARTRSRNHSPVSSRCSSLSSSPHPQEAHIHPGFRSDSMEPPPVATPGTSVVASPIAGQVISPRSSMRSLKRMRSGSLPATSSPLSRQSSFEDGAARRPKAEQARIEEVREEQQEGASTSRQMTPPIPDWILSAGNRSSLHDYKRRTLREESGELDIGVAQ